MDSSDIEHVTEPRDATVSRSLDILISNSPLGFSFDNEAIETLELADILLNSEPNKPKDLCISENAVTDHNSDSLNVESLSSEENRSNAVFIGKSQIIFSSEDSDCPESAFIPSVKSSMSGSHAKENKSGTKESVPVMEQKQDEVQISVATDKNSADIDEISQSSSENTEIFEKCISKSSFLGITKSTEDKGFDEKIIINDKEEVNNGDKRKIQDKQGKEGKSCSGKLEKSHKVVDTMYGSLDLAGSLLEASVIDDQNSSCAEKIAGFQEKTLSSDMCLAIKEVTDSNEQPTHVDSSDSQPGSSQLTDNEMEENDQGHSLADAVGRDHDTEKVADSKQQCREIKQPIIKLADFLLNTSSKTNQEDKKLPNKSKRSWSVKLTAPVASQSKKRIRKVDKEEKISFEEQVNQSIFSEKRRNEKPFFEAETVNVNISKKEQKDLKQLENKNEAPALLADDCNSDRLNTKDEVSVKAKVGFSLNGVLSESVSFNSIVSSSSSCTQPHADLNGEENNVGKDDAVNRNMQNEIDVQLYSNFQSHHPSSSKYSTPTTKRKITTNTLDIVPIDGKIPTIKLHRMNHPGHLSSHSQTVYESKMAKLRTEDTPCFSGSYENTQSQHGTQSHAEKGRIPKHSAALGKRNRDMQISDPVSVDGKVPMIKLQKINSLEKQEKGDMPLNMNSLMEPSDSKLRKTNLCPNKGKRKVEKKNPSPRKQSGIDFETSCFESEEEDNIVSKDLLDSLLEKVTADYSLLFGSELNMSKEDNKTDGDSIQVMNVESGGLTGALGGPLANMSPIAGPSLVGHCFNYVSEQQSSRRIKSDTDLRKKKSDTVKKVGITKRLKSYSSESNHYNNLQKTMAVKENFSHHEQQDVTCNDNSKDLLPKDTDGVDPEVEKLIRKLKSSDYRKRKNLEPVVLLTRIDDQYINLADTSLKGYDLNFSQKKQTDTFALKGNEKNVSSKKQTEFKSTCKSSRRLLVPLEHLDSPIKTGNSSRQSVDKKCLKKSSFVNGKHEESVKVEVHASWFEMDNDISDGNIKFKERNSPFESSSSPIKKVRKDQELNNEVLGTVTEKTNKKRPDSAGVKCKNINEHVLKPDNLTVNCATCAYLSSPDSRHVKETYAGKGILNRHVMVAIQRLDSEIDCASVSSLNIKEDKVDQRKKQAEGKKRLRHKKEKRIHCLTEAEHDTKSNEMKSVSEADEAWKSNAQCEAGTSGSEIEDAKSLVVKISKVLTKKEDSGFKGMCLPKEKCDNHGKDVYLSSEVKVKLEKLDMENTPHPFFSKITHQDSSYLNPEASNEEIGPSSNVLTKDKSEVHCVTTDSGKLLSKQCTGPSGKKSCHTDETLNSFSELLQRPDDDADEVTDSNDKNQSGVISLPGIDAELTKTREKSAVRSDQKTRDKELITVDSEPESDGAASPFPEPLVEENVNDLPYGMDTNTDFIGTKHGEPLIKREKETTPCHLVPESPNVHRSPSDPWPKLSQVTDTMDKSDSSEDTDISSTLSPQDTSQRKKLMEAYKRRLDTIQDKDYKYEHPEPVDKSQTKRSLSFSDEDGEVYNIRPGVIILDPR